MLRLGWITPTARQSLDEFATQSDGIHLVHAALVGDNEYTNFYIQRSARGDKIYLDNSALSGLGVVPLEQMVDRANIVGASVLIAPETPRDNAIKTIENLTSFLEVLGKKDVKDKFDILVVPHSTQTPSGLEQYITVYKELLQMPSSIEIGFSTTSAMVMEPQTGSSNPSHNRIALVSKLAQLCEWTLPIQHVHCFLGLHEPHEVQVQAELGTVFEHSSVMFTSLPILCGINRTCFVWDSKTREYYMRGKINIAFDYKYDINFEQKPYIWKNMAILHRLSKGFSQAKHQLEQGGQDEKAVSS